jgi:PAS domain S-box-containing protein
MFGLQWNKYFEGGGGSQMPAKQVTTSLTYVEKTIQYMSYHILDKIILEDLAKVVNLCQGHYIRIFKQVTGIPPMEYFLKMKINKAAELLSTTDESITEISNKLLFSSGSHFNRTFKKFKEMNPSQYRKKYQYSSSNSFVEKSENSYKLSFSLIQTIFDSLPDLIFYKNQTGVILGCNKAFCRVMGLDKEQIVGKSDYTLFPKDEADWYKFHDEAVLKSKSPQRNREWMSLPDGTMRRYEVLKAPFFDENGNLMGLVGMSRDITDLMKD